MKFHHLLFNSVFSVFLKKVTFDRNISKVSFLITPLAHLSWMLCNPTRLLFCAGECKTDMIWAEEV